ncbi:MAG: AMP-binding protein [Clostridia bacterium]|nr:AMP-binding protein [Clostridia bacterium]
MKAFYKVREFNDIRELMDMSTNLFGDKPAFEVKRQDGTHYNITYRDYRKDIDAFGTAITSMGFSDARIAICADNCYEYCLTYISTICGLGVVVPVDKELSSDDVNGILNAAEIDILVCDEKQLNRLDFSGAPKDMTVVCVRMKEDKEGVLRFETLLEDGHKLLAQGNADYLNIPLDPEKLCTLLFTSGTTGLSKGVMLCQRNFVFEVKAAMGVIKIYPEDCGISLLPLHHTFESSIILFFAPYCGAKVTFCEGFKYVLRNMKEFNPSIFVAVPLVLQTVHRRILKAVKAKPHGETMFKVGKVLCKAGSKIGLDLKKVFFKEIQQTFGGNMRMIICGGAPIDPQILEDFDAFGIQIVFGYGLTECAPLAIINHDRLHLAESVGEPLPGTQTKIFNPDEEGVGEICVKGDMVMLGYYNNPEATAEVMDEDGFFHTGDMGYMDKKGHVYLTGRCKNVIVTSNGKNIYPEELEYQLSRDPVVSDCMVLGKDNAKGELEVHAQIFPDMAEVKERLGTDKPSSEELETLFKDVVEGTNGKLAKFKRIKGFSLRDKDFVKTTTQKIKRFENV